MSPRAPRDPHPFTTDAYPREVTTEDLAAIGEALLGAIAGMFAMGHASTASLADYVATENLDWRAQLVMDAVALSHDHEWSDRKRAAMDRMSGFVWQSGWMHRVADQVAEVGAPTFDADLDGAPRNSSPLGA